MDRPAELSAVARVRVRRKDIDASFQIELPSFLASFASTFAYVRLDYLEKTLQHT
jgi:hypothetical protein